MRAFLIASALFAAIAVAAPNAAPEAEAAPFVGDENTLYTRDDLACGGAGVHCPKGQKWCKDVKRCVDCALLCPKAEIEAREAAACDSAGVHCPKGQKWCPGKKICKDCALKCS